MAQAQLSGGFSDAPRDAAEAFRGLMTAMACPGQIKTVTGAEPPAPLSVAAGVALLTLLDVDTPLYLSARYDTSQLRQWITFHTSAPIVSAEQAQFALGTWDELPLSAFALGTSEYPDRSATLIVEMEALSNTGATLSGPGIKDTAELSLPELQAFEANAQHFPLGLDFFFTCGSDVAALPRTTRVSAGAHDEIREGVS